LISIIIPNATEKPLSIANAIPRGYFKTTWNYSLFVSKWYHVKKENNTENINKQDKISVFQIK